MQVVQIWGSMQEGHINMVYGEFAPEFEETSLDQGHEVNIILKEIIPLYLQ